jgi:hypothetical protein
MKLACKEGDAFFAFGTTNNHRSNLVDNTEKGGRPWVLNLNLRRSQSRKRGKICLDQSLIDIHPFPSLLPQIFICLPSPQ